MSAADRRAPALVDQVRRRLTELAQMSEDEKHEAGVHLNSELAALADQLTRVQGLMSAGEDPLGGTYRSEIGNLRSWLRVEGHEPDCPVEPGMVARWLEELARDRAPSSMRRFVAGVRSWHRAEGHLDPVESSEVQELLAKLKKAEEDADA